MSKHQKVFMRILAGGSDDNIPFDDLCSLLRHLGFVERTRGSHHIFARPGVQELINLQRPGRQAKGYQVRQVRAILVKYDFQTGGAE
jgi:predicted RNA binding protein YcfA (HicA-like mRNA interferase family)